MEPKTAAKVGGFVLVALLLFGGLYLYLAHLSPNTYKVNVVFDNTQGLLKQSLVRMQGVAIGEVSRVDLDTSKRPPQPLVTLSIANRYHIPTDSKFRIVSGLLISNPQIEIDPGPDVTVLPTDGSAEVKGEPPQGALATLSPELSTTVGNLNKTMADLTTKFDAAYKKIDVVLDQTNRLMTTTNKAAASANSIISDPSVKRSLLATLDNFRQTSAEARKTSQDLSLQLHETIVSSRGNLDRLGHKVNDLLDHVDTTIENANTVVLKLTEQVTDPRFQQSLTDTAELARATLARFNQIASDIHELTGDPQLQGDLKQTVANLKGATEKVQAVTEKVDTLLTRLTGGNGKVARPRLPHVDVLTNVSEQLDPTRLRLDLDARVALGTRNLLDVGLYDVGQDTRLNLQAGVNLLAGPNTKPGESTESLIARYGIYASKIGVGMDYEGRSGIGFRADLWDTNRPRLDVRGLFRVNKNAQFWIGADSLLRTSIPIIGVQLKN